MSIPDSLISIVFRAFGVVAYYTAHIIWIATKVAFHASAPTIKAALSTPVARARTTPRSVSTGSNFTDYEPSIPRCVQFPGIGYLTLWGFKSKMVVKRQLTISDQNLVDRLGAYRIPMSEMTWPTGISLEVLEDCAIDDVKLMLKKKLDANVPTVLKAHKDPDPDLVVTNDQVVKQAKKSEHSSVHKNVAKRAVVDSARGILEFAGISKRTMGDRDIQHFAVDVGVPGVGTRRLWGIDLERAIERAHASVGDEVSIEYTGTSPVYLENGTVEYKKHYIVQKLGNSSKFMRHT